MRLSLVRISVLPGSLGRPSFNAGPRTSAQPESGNTHPWMVLCIIVAFGPVETCTAAPGSFDRPDSPNGTGGFDG